MKAIFILIFLLSISLISKGQVKVEPKKLNEKLESLDNYFIINTIGQKFSVTFKNKKLVFADSTRLDKYITKNMKLFDNKVALKYGPDSNSKLFRIASHILDNHGIYMHRLIYQD